MARTQRFCLYMMLMASALSLGCFSTGKGTSVFTPYRGSNSVEELRSPPADDTRYTQAPSYPQQLLKPVVKIKDEENGTGLRRAPLGQSGMGPMGGMPGQGGY